MYDRIVDNSKVLAATGLKQVDFVPLFTGLKRELNSLGKEDVKLLSGSAVQSELMDLYYGQQ